MCAGEVWSMRHDAYAEMNMMRYADAIDAAIHEKLHDKYKVLIKCGYDSQWDKVSMIWNLAD